MLNSAQCYLTNIGLEEGLDLVKSLVPLESLLRLRYSGLRTSGDFRIASSGYLAKVGFPRTPCAIEFIYGLTDKSLRSQRRAVIEVERDGKVRLVSDEKA